MTTSCVFAKHGLAVQNDGLMTPCSHSQSYFTDDSGNLLYAHTQSLEQGWNSPKRWEIVNDLENGIQHPNCHQCWEAEAGGLRSARMHANDTWLSKLDPTLDQPQLITLKPGNGCNLKCRTCTPWISNQWYKDFYLGNYYPDGKVTDYKQFMQIFEHTRQSWKSSNSLVWDWLDTWAEKVVFWDLYGGEPTISVKLWDFFEEKSTLGYINNYHIHLNTNGTVYSDKYENLIKQFKSVQLDISIDGIGSQYEYLRHPANWITELNNLQKYKQLAKESRNISMMSVVTTMSIFNILYSAEIFEYLKSIGYEMNMNNMVFKPDYYDMRILPKEAKLAIVDKLQNYEFKGIMNYEIYKWKNVIAPGLIGFLLQDVPNQEEKFNKFWTYTQRYDQLRNESFANTFPELYQLIIDYLPKL